jgi:hypothetical protein
MPTPKSTSKVGVLRGQDALDAYQKSIRPEAVAKANLDAKKALETKYPGMFLPEVRTSTHINRGN